MAKKTKRKPRPAPEPDSEFGVVPPTEAALIDPLDEDLADAWSKLRAFAADLGEQRIYASATAVMFARRVVYLFVRPKKSYLQVNIVLPKLMSRCWAGSGTRLNLPGERCRADAHMEICSTSCRLTAP